MTHRGDDPDIIEAVARAMVSRRAAIIAASAAAGAAAIGLDFAWNAPAFAATTYIYPTSSRIVSDNFDAHVLRGSVNPGTDYVCSRGTDVLAVAGGVVVIADSSTGGSGGRIVGIDHDDGSKTDYLHLSSLNVSVNQRVEQGQLIALSGASGYGEETYYGPHLHISLHTGPGAAHLTTGGSVDFELYVGERNNSEGDTLSQAEVDAINAHIDAQVANLLVGIRREARARLYFDAGPTGSLPEANATRYIVAKLTDGFVYPLNPDPSARAGQLLSLRQTPYELIDAQEVAVGLATDRFNNLLEMANGHIRRIAAEVIRQTNGGPTPPVTSTVPATGVTPTRAL